MDVIGTIAAFLGVLVVLVLVHEIGHYIVAKRAGITVEEFGIGSAASCACWARTGTSSCGGFASGG
jgi:regulator of sigma E protease